MFIFFQKSLTNVKEIPKGNFEYDEKARVMTEQFPTFGNWVAEQISRKPVIVGAVPNLNTTSNQSAVYKVRIYRIFVY